MSKILQKSALAKKIQAEETEALLQVSEGEKLPSKSSLKKRKSKVSEDGSHIVYVGHIPDGFFEKQMRGFFSQFGVVKRLKLFRSPKTMNSKGYGFIEFETPEIAAVVASTMNGYFLGGKQIVCDVVAKEKLHEGMFYPNKRRRKLKEVPPTLTDEEKEMKNKAKAKRFCEARERKKEKLRELGIDFEMPVPLTQIPLEDEE